MAGPRLLDTEITTRNHNRAGQVGMLRLGARPGARHRERPCAGMPARAPAGTVVWWWTWLGDHGVPGAGDRWRAVWYEGGVRRQCQAVSEGRLAGMLTQKIEVWPFCAALIIARRTIASRSTFSPSVRCPSPSRRGGVS